MMSIGQGMAQKRGGLLTDCQQQAAPTQTFDQKIEDLAPALIPSISCLDESRMCK